jgi:hypothetical protein
MQLNLIIEIFDFIKKEIESKQIIAKYELMLAIIKKSTGSPDKDFSNELSEAKNSLILAQNEIEPIGWSYSKYRMYIDLDKDSITGKRAVANLNSIFDANHNKPSDIAKELKKIIANINNVLNAKTDPLKLLSCFSSTESVSSDMTLLTLFFEGKTTVNTINDIERYSRLWDNIIKDFAILTMQTDCSPAIESIDKNSMILHIANGDKIVDSLSYGTSRIIETYSKILRIRKLQLEAIEMVLNHEILDLLEDEISNTINETSQNVVYDLMEKYNWDNMPARDETFHNVDKSLKRILDFIEKGGKIECQLTDNTTDISGRNNLFLAAYQLVSEINETVKEINLQGKTAEESVETQF